MNARFMVAPPWLVASSVSRPGRAAVRGERPSLSLPSLPVGRAAAGGLPDTDPAEVPALYPHRLAHLGEEVAGHRLGGGGWAAEGRRANPPPPAALRCEKSRPTPRRSSVPPAATTSTRQSWPCCG